MMQTMKRFLICSHKMDTVCERFDVASINTQSSDNKFRMPDDSIPVMVDDRRYVDVT